MLKVRERWVDSGGGGAAANGGGAPEKVSTQRPTQRFINPRNPQKTLHHFTRITAIFLFPIGYIYPQAFSKNGFSTIFNNYKPFFTTSRLSQLSKLPVLYIKEEKV